MKLIFHGYLADLMGRELQMDSAASCTIAEVRGRLIAEHLQVEKLLSNERVRACVADRFVDDNYRVTASDTVEFLPPVSGG